MTRTLEHDLRDAVDAEVRFSSGDRALYAADASNFREVPRGVVIPKSMDEMAKIIAICARHGASIVHRGGGTSLAGQTVSAGSVVIDSSKYCNRILEIDPQARLARVEPGVVLDDLRKAAGEHGLTFGPDPATHNHNTLGGMLGNNSCGVHSLYARRTVDNVRELEALTYDGARLTLGATSDEVLAQKLIEPGREGEIYRGLKALRDGYADEIRRRYPRIPRRVSGYSLDELLPERGFHVGRALVGSESTCVTILSATLELVPDPKHKVLLVIGFDDVANAADAVPDLLKFRHDKDSNGLIALEGMDADLPHYMKVKDFRVEDLQYLSKGNGWLLAQFGGDTQAEAEHHAEACRQRLKPHPHVVDMRLLSDPEEREKLWKVREAGLGSTAWVPGMADTWPGWEDSAVGPEQLGAYMRELKALYAKYDYKGSMYGHFGDGLIHTRITFGLHTDEQVANYRSFLEEAAALVVRYGGTLSGEHGDGRQRAELLPIMYGEKLIEAFGEFKRIWDPLGRMNPGKIVNPKPLDTDLRYGPQFERQKPEYHTLLQFPESRNSFSRAVMRCVGVGECRRHEGGTMCPSYRGTREEKHSTRGRSRLLQEMLEGDPIRNDMQSDAVHEALDLCLSCKACKHECPVSVDMASYRAEFLHHYFKSHPRPLASYGMGLVHVWAPWAAKAPWLMNLITQTPGLSAIAKIVAGVHPDRDLPKIAGKTARAQWRSASQHRDKRAILWMDSFNNHFTPAPLLAAGQVLELSGHEVMASPKGLCCGRPFYDYGRLEAARAYLERCLDVLTPLLDERTWLVGVEPSCLSVFKTELLSFFPDDARAKRLSERALTLGQYLTMHGHAPIYLERDVAVHGHCHHKSVIGIDAEIALLSATGRKAKLLDDGCCGMAGAFGYETQKYPVSEAIAKQGLLEHLDQTPDDHLIAADGFSCRHQITHFSKRQHQTLPELLLAAMTRGETA
ncbi:MAG TPA: FAD-binding and (Fe-S)-binding domain-containing protein [Asticcacaulis sp.]|nr:FAD-binding and (Fe-S)-binding domain-containing protein [Asticcacaulis sp.]